MSSTGTRRPTSVALILDPPLKSLPREEQVPDFLALTDQLEDLGWNRDPDRGWVALDAADLRAHEDIVAKIYERANTDA